MSGYYATLPSHARKEGHGRQHGASSGEENSGRFTGKYGR